MINPGEMGLNLNNRLTKTVLFNELGDRWISRRKLISGSKTNLLELGEVKYKNLLESYRKLVSVNWPVETYDMARDQRENGQISEPERKTYERVISSLIFLTSELQSDYLILEPYFTAPELTIILSTMGYQASFHAYALSYMVKKVIPQAEWDLVYNSWRTIERLRERNKFLNSKFLEFSNNPIVSNFMNNLLATSMVCTVFAPSELSLVYSITRRSKLQASYEILKRIQRDMDAHSQIMVGVFQEIIAENPSLESAELKEHTITTIRDLTNIETDLLQFLTESMLPGLNNLMIAKFAQAQTNKLLKQLGMDPLFPGVGGQPIPWFEGYTEVKQH